MISDYSKGQRDMCALLLALMTFDRGLGVFAAAIVFALAWATIYGFLMLAEWLRACLVD